MPGKKQKEHTYTLDGFITGEAGGGGLISGIISSLANGWTYIQEGLKPWGGGALNMGLYGILLSAWAPCSFMYVLLTISTYHVSNQYFN